MSHNNIFSIPSRIGISSLSTLDLSYNKLTRLENLPMSLYSLYINNNYIATINIANINNVPLSTNLDNNYLACSKYAGYSNIKSRCTQSKQYSCGDQTLGKCEELKRTYGICTPNSKQTKCLRYTSGVKEFCDFAADVGIEGCQEIYSNESCVGTVNFHGFVYNCFYEYITGYNPKTTSDFLTEVPASASNLTKLTTLTLSGLSLSSLPESYANFGLVKTLNLTYNRFTAIPEVAYNFKELSSMDISRNKLQSLPDDFFAQVSLSYFYAHHNYLSKISNTVYRILPQESSKVNLDYNFLDCQAYEFSKHVCNSPKQFVCSEVDKEGCNAELSKGKCKYNSKSGTCVKQDEKDDDKITYIVSGTICLVIYLIVQGSYLIYKKKKQAEYFRRQRLNKPLIPKVDKRDNGKNVVLTPADDEDEPTIDNPIQDGQFKGEELSEVNNHSRIVSSINDEENAAAVIREISPIKNLYSKRYVKPTMKEALLEADLTEKKAEMVCSACENAASIKADEGELFEDFTEEDAAAIAMYTYDFGLKDYESNPYRITNKSLAGRNYADLQKARGLLYLIMTALRKLPRVTGKTLYRGVRGKVKLDEDHYIKGNVITWPALSSTSPDMETTKTFLPKGPNSGNPTGTLFIIENGWGYDIQPYSLFPGETEILLEPERQFKVTSVIKGDLTIINLQMLDTPLTLPDIFGKGKKGGADMV